MTIPPLGVPTSASAAIASPHSDATSPCLKKQTPSRLDPYEETLFAMDAAKKTLTEMRQWLASQNVAISFQGIAKFLTSRRRRRWQAEMLSQIVSGQRPVEQAKTALQSNPEPDLETLIKLSRFLIFEHAIQIMPKPGCAAKSSQTTKMVINYLNRHAKLVYQEKEIALADRKLAVRVSLANKLDPEKREMLLATFAPTLSGAKNHPPGPAGDSASFNPFQPLSTIKSEKIS